MAELSFLVPTIPFEKDFAALVIRYFRRIAHARPSDRPIEFQYRWRKSSRALACRHYKISISGDFADLQALSFESSRALYHFGSGVKRVTPRLRRSRVHEVIAISFAKAIIDRSDQIDSLSEWASNENITAFKVNSLLFQRTGYQQADESMRILSQALIQHRNRDIATEALIEQLHTSLELLLKKATNVQRKEDAVFDKMANRARDLGLISDDQRFNILKIKEARRGAKHRGQAISRTRAKSLIYEGVAVCHSFIATLKSSQRRTSLPNDDSL